MLGVDPAAGNSLVALGERIDEADKAGSRFRFGASAVLYPGINYGSIHRRVYEVVFFILSSASYEYLVC